MIASRSGLIVCWVCVLVLGGVLALDLRGDAANPDRALVPGFDATKVTALGWSGSPLTFEIERDKTLASGWKWVDPDGEADRQTVEDLLAALRGARWHRRAGVEAAGAITTTLTVDVGEHLTFAIGQPLADQQWLVTGDHAFLVERWVVHALAPDPVTLRVQHPFATAVSANQIAVGSFELVGSPRRLTKLAGLPIDLLVRAPLVETLEHVLGDWTVLAIPRSKVPVDTVYRGTRFELGGKLVAVEVGRCPAPDITLHAIVGPVIGAACVSEAGWLAALAAAAVFDVRDTGGRMKSLAALVEPRPIPISANLVPTGAVLVDGSLLELARRPRVRDPKQPAVRDADPTRVAELFAVLATPGDPVALPAAAPIGHLQISAHDATFAFDLFPGSVIARHGEPIALRIGDGSFAVLARGGNAYVDPTLWSEEPLTIQTIRIASAVYTRGQVAGEWSRDGKPAAASVDALVGALASLRSRGPSPAPATSIEITLEIVPPAGAPTKHTLEIGRAGATCAATINSTSVAIDPVLCDGVETLR